MLLKPIGLMRAVVAAGGDDPEFGALGTTVSMGSSGALSQSSTLANVAADDLVLAFIQRDQQAQCTGVSMAGTAMTKIKTAASGSSGFDFDVWALIAPSAVSSATITASYSEEFAWGTIMTARWSGVSSATPLATSCNTTGCSGLATSSTNRLAQSITTTERALLIACGTDWNDVRTHTAASGWTKRADGSGTPVTSIQFIHDRVADAGTYGGATAFSTTSAADSYLSILLAFA